MTAAANTFGTYGAAGNREDLIDLITNISPTATPFMSSIGSTRATSVLHEWQTQALASPTGNAHIEGDETAAGALTATTRVNNRAQILKKVFIVSGTQEAVDKAGRSSELNYQTGLKLAELANDIEWAMINNTSAVSGASAVARQMKGIMGFVSTNTSSATARRVLTETLLSSLLSDVWSEGGSPDMLLCGGFNKRKVDAFSTNTREISAESAKLVANVDIYKSSFGTMDVKLSHAVNTKHPDRLIAVETKRWRKAFLRPVKREELSKTGDAKKYHVVAECTLESLAENANGLFYKATTA